METCRRLHHGHQAGCAPELGSRTCPGGLSQIPEPLNPFRQQLDLTLVPSQLLQANLNPS